MGQPDPDPPAITRCPVPKCGRLHPRSYLMCPMHWAKVPPVLKAAVWLHYRQGQEKDGWAGATDAYKHAALAAISSVSPKALAPTQLPLDG